MAKKAHGERAALLAILLLAAWLRVGWPGVNSFSFDEARVSVMALQMAREGRFAPLGMQSSAGIPNFPGAVWLFALPYALTTDPLIPTLLVGFLNVVAAAGMWRLGRSAWGKWGGLCSALLFAASPFGVFYSRGIWAQDLLAPLAVFWALAATRGIRTGRSRALAAHVFLAGFAGQVHPAGFALALATAWLALRWRLWRRWRPVIAGGVAAALCALPAVYTILRHGDGARAFIGEYLGRPSTISPLSVLVLGRMGIGDGWESLILGFGWQWPDPLSQMLTAASVIAGALFFIGAAITLRKAITERKVILSLLPAWLLCAPLMFLASKKGVAPQYVLVSLPAFFIITGAVAARRRWGKIAVALILIAALSRTLALARTFDIIRVTATRGGMGTPLLYPRAAAKDVRDGGLPVTVLTHGDMVEYDGDAAAFKVLLWDHPHRIADARSAIVIPEGGATLLATFDTLAAWEVAGDLGILEDARNLPRRALEPPYVAAYSSIDALSGFEQAPPYALANGAELVGWRAVEKEGGLRLITHWRLTRAIEGQFQQFHHLYAAENDELIAIKDVNVSSQAWQPGDHLITWADFEMPGGPFYVNIGMYTWPDLQRSPVSGREGDPLAPIKLGPTSEPALP